MLVDGGAPQVALVFKYVVGCGSVDRAAIVPYDEIAWAPPVRVNEFGLRRECIELVQEPLSLCAGPAHDLSRMIADIQGAAAGLRNEAHHGVRHGRHGPAHVVGDDAK